MPIKKEKNIEDRIIDKIPTNLMGQDNVNKIVRLYETKRKLKQESD